MSPDRILRSYVVKHNQGVRSGDFSSMLALFHADARLSFRGIAVGPFRARESIAQAFASDPPSDTLLLLGEPAVDGDTVSAPYGWAARPTQHAGTLAAVVQGGVIVELCVSVA